MGYVVMYWLNYKENRNFFLNYLILYIFWKRKKNYLNRCIFDVYCD